MRRTYDAIVIGAGVMGASIAFHLARLGVRNTLVIERGTVCSGNTRKSGALVRMHYSNQPEARLALASLTYFHHWRDLVGGDAGFKNVGFVLLVGPENEDKLRRNVAMQQRLGINTRVVSADELREIQPSINLDDGAVGAFEPDSGYADPVAATHAFMRAARDQDVALSEGVTVTSIEQRSGRVSCVVTSEGKFEAPTVICAANIWSTPLLRSARFDLDLWPLRSQMAFYKRPAALRKHGRVLLDLAQLNYCRPHEDDLYLVGTPVRDQKRVDPDNYNEGNDADFPSEARDRMATRIPQFRDAAYVRGQAGVYDMSPDTRAILDRAPGVDGLLVAAGFSGTGFKISPIVGACMAELAVRGEATSADIRPFRFSRFAEKEPIRGDDEYDLPWSWGMKW
jgi:sarcosine oxidase, subunit beta